MAEYNHRARPADLEDVRAIAGLVDEYAGPGYLLPRQREDIRRTIDLWRIVRSPEGLLACGSLLPYSDELAEVRSMAVAPGRQGQGLGSAVLTELIEEGHRRGFEALFALTRAVRFFEDHGFSVSHRLEFPEKVWRDCLGCPFLDNCDETAVALDLAWDRGVRSRTRPTTKKGEYHAAKRS